MAYADLWISSLIYERIQLFYYWNYHMLTFQLIMCSLWVAYKDIMEIVLLFLIQSIVQLIYFPKWAH